MAQGVGAAEELLEGWWGLPALPVETPRSQYERAMGMDYLSLPAPLPPPVGAAVSSQVEVGEVGAAAMK